MVLERERPAAVQTCDLERPVAARQTLVGDGDPRLLGRPDAAIHAREHAPQGTDQGHVA